MEKEAFNGFITTLKKLVTSSNSSDFSKIINGLDQTGQPLLYYAILYKSNDAIDFLIEHGADVNKIQFDTHSINEALLAYLSSKGYPEFKNLELGKLLLGFKTNPKVADLSGLTSLHYAALQKEDFAILEYLVKKGYNINAEGKERVTPLDVALSGYIYNDNSDNDTFIFDNSAVIKKIQFLIDAGARIDDLSDVNDQKILHMLSEGEIDLGYMCPGITEPKEMLAHIIADTIKSRALNEKLSQNNLIEQALPTEEEIKQLLSQMTIIEESDNNSSHSASDLLAEASTIDLEAVD